MDSCCNDPLRGSDVLSGSSSAPLFAMEEVMVMAERGGCKVGVHGSGTQGLQTRTISPPPKAGLRVVEGEESRSLSSLRRLNGG